MNKRYIESAIPKAIELIKNNSKIYHKEGYIPNEFNGYISSFLVSVTMSGAIQSIIFYSDKGSAKFHRDAMLEVIRELMEVQDLRRHMEDYPMDKEKLLDSAIAFKMALRVFTLKKG